jgi:large subunit ribosomal protein L22
MEINAKLRYLRVSPRKARLVAGVVRGMDIEGARVQLMFSKKGVAAPILKLLNSAISNAKNNFSKTEGLYVKKIFVDQGPVYKRFHPQPKGVAGPINKRTSHITIVLDERVKKAKATP